MPLTPEQEINLLFKDVLELAGSPEKARSALRNFLWLKEQEADTVPLCCACANELTPAAPPPPASLSSFSAAPILLPPGTGPVRRTIIPPNEHSWGQHYEVLVPERGPTVPAQERTELTKPLFYNFDERLRISTPPGSSISEQDFEDVRLASHALDQITVERTKLPPAEFRYVRYKISQDQDYLGEAARGHYKIRGAGYFNGSIKVPNITSGFKVPQWYAVTVGKAIGIFLNWSEVDDIITGVSGNAHKSFKSFREAVEFIQAALLLGSIEVVPA